MRPDRELIWTPDTTLLLRDLWSRHEIPLSEIGRRIGVTRSAIASKAHRLDLPPRPAPVPNAGRPRGTGNTKPRFVERAAVKPFFAKQPTFHAPDPLPGGVTVPFSQCRTCQFPMWPNGVFNPKPALYCGQPTDIGSWCLAHARIVFQPEKPKDGPHDNG